MLEVLNTLCKNVFDMRLLVEGALALFEDEWNDDPQEIADLMGEALYMLRERLRTCQRAIDEQKPLKLVGKVKKNESEAHSG